MLPISIINNLYAEKAITYHGTIQWSKLIQSQLLGPFRQSSEISLVDGKGQRSFWQNSEVFPFVGNVRESPFNSSVEAFSWKLLNETAPCIVYTEISKEWSNEMAPCIVYTEISKQWSNEMAPWIVMEIIKGWSNETAPCIAYICYRDTITERRQRRRYK